VLDHKTINTPIWFYDALISSASLRTDVSRRIDFAVFVDTSTDPTQGLLSALDPHMSWECSSENGYAVCEKAQRTSSSSLL
jgi:hypothetical protein